MDDNANIIIKSNVQNMHIANSDKPVVFYSLDVILAVGYRAKKPERFDRCRKSISGHPKANAEEIESRERQR